MADLFKITQAQAKEYITNWKECQNAILNHLGATSLNTLPLTINAFTFDLADLQGLMQNITTYNLQALSNPVNAVRFYLSIETFPDTPVSPEVGLIAVSVTDFHPNAIFQSGGNDLLRLTAGGTDIHNFSYPCPTTCATMGHSIMDES